MKQLLRVQRAGRILGALVLATAAMIVASTTAATAGSASWDLDDPAEYVLSDTASVEVDGSVGKLAPTAPFALLSSVDLEAPVSDVVVSPDGQTLYAMARAAGVVVFDISDPRVDPVRIGILNTPQTAWRGKLSQDGQLLYVADYGDALIIDVSDPANPTQIGVIDLGRVWDVALSNDGNTLYAADSSARSLVVIDVTDPAAPVTLGFWATGGPVPVDLTVLPDGTVMVGANSSTFRVDVSDPTAPVGVLFQSGGSYNSHLSADGKLFYNTASGITTVFDITGPGANVALSTIPETSGYDSDDTSDARLAVFSRDSLGFRAVDMSDPAVPVVLADIDTQSVYGLDIAPSDCEVYLADGGGASGVKVYSLAETFSTDVQYLTANTAQRFEAGLTSFDATVGTGNAEMVTFQVSSDGGTTWRYWDGAAWVDTTAVDGTETVDATVVDANIATLDTHGEFTWRAFLGNGEDHCQPVELHSVSLGVVDAVRELSLVMVGELTVGDGSTVGDVITYTLTVTNNGNVALTKLSIDDLPSGSFSPEVVESIAPGEEVTFTGTYSVTQADIDAGVVRNRALVSGLDLFGGLVSDESDSVRPADDTGAGDDMTVTVLATAAPASPTPAAPPTEPVLAFTGADTGVLWVGLAVEALGLAILVAAVRRRSTNPASVSS